jgi:hypothetical protein
MHKENPLAAGGEGRGVPGAQDVCPHNILLKILEGTEEMHHLESKRIGAHDEHLIDHDEGQEPIPARRKIPSLNK